MAKQKHPAGPAMTLANMRALGVQNLLAWCLNDACRHTALIDVSNYPLESAIVRPARGLHQVRRPGQQDRRAGGVALKMASGRLDRGLAGSAGGWACSSSGKLRKGIGDACVGPWSLFWSHLYCQRWCQLGFCT